MLNWNEIQTIGILVRLEDPTDAPILAKFVDKLKKAGKKVQTTLIRSEKDSPTETGRQKNILPQDFNWVGIVKDEAIDRLPTNPDLLLCAGDANDRQFMSCVVKSKAAIKISNQLPFAQSVDLVVPSELKSKINSLRIQVEVIKSLSPDKQPAGI